MIYVTKADYVSEYKIHIYFSDGTDRVVDFEKYLFNVEHTYPEYRKIAKFKTFKIDKGELVWGENWDIVFPTYKLHSGKIISGYEDHKSEPFMVFEV